MQRLSKRTISVLVALAAMLVTMLVVAGPTGAAENKIRVWTDKDRKTAVEKVVGAWAASKGLSVEVLEKDFGKIAPGLLADFVVLSQDITKVLPKDLLKTRVLLTVMGGQETYRAKDFTAGALPARAR